MPGVIFSPGAGLMHGNPSVIAKCLDFESQFETAGATVEEKQHYASCVRLLYPRENAWPAPWEIFGLKLAFIIIVLSTAVGAWKGDRLFDGIERRLMGAVNWLTNSSMVVMIVGGGVEVAVRLFF